MCDKAVNTYNSTIQFVPDCYRTQEMCDRALFEDLFTLLPCPDRYKTQKMCDEAIDDYLVALKFILDCFFTNKIIKKLLTGLYTDDHIFYFNEDSSDVIFSCNQMDILSVDLNNTNHGDTNYDEDDPETIVHVRLFAWNSKFEKRNALKKKISKELMPLVWHPKIWWNFCISEHEKKEIEQTFTE